MSPDFTFVTCSALPNLDPDDRLALDLINGRGAAAVVAVWDDPQVDWARAGICVLRSTWDYHLRHEQFLRWCSNVAQATRLYNPLPLIRWNIVKNYLQQLELAGVPIVPTHWVERGSRVDLAALLSSRAWPRAVIKPSIGLSTYGVRRVSQAGDGVQGDQMHLDSLLQRHDVLVQPYIGSVNSYGERALMFIDGQFSHAARKTAFQALLPAGEAGETPATATPQEIAVASQAVAALPQPSLYARVDLVHDENARPLVLELEVIEPTLFLGMAAHAPGRFADAVMALR
ncbi:MAG: hypothetical protein M3Z37_00620 [Candidatus Eremiobacteraeota bacterium]|nr:hypothetical protein [Candidatus Eremiobacteraeota bacterium]